MRRISAKSVSREGAKTMRTTSKSAIMAVAIVLVALHALGQEVVPTPVPADAARATPHVSANTGDQYSAGPAANATARQEANRWRYRWSNGRWWYWTPQSCWMWYSDDGRWIKYDPAVNPPAVERADRPAAYGYSYYRPNGYFFPGVAVGVRPYGNVDVGVGRRIGVGVWGPHGSVRVGRIFVGW
jgi:hypothetical protein